MALRPARPLYPACLHWATTTCVCICSQADLPPRTEDSTKGRHPPAGAGCLHCKLVYCGVGTTRAGGQLTGAHTRTHQLVRGQLGQQGEARQEGSQPAGSQVVEWAWAGKGRSCSPPVIAGDSNNKIGQCCGAGTKYHAGWIILCQNKQAFNKVASWHFYFE